MNNLNVVTQKFNQNGYTKFTYTFEGDLVSKNALQLKNNVSKWFNTHITECVIDLNNTEKMDIVGINILVKLRMLAMKNNIRFSINAPYRKEIVEQFEHTKLAKPLNVLYRVENVARVA